jgi:predicted acetyltransferase
VRSVIDARDLRLRPPGRADEEEFAAAHTAMATEGFTFGLGYETGMPWSRYLDEVEKSHTGTDLPPGWVPATLLVADVGGTIVGRTSIRHALNDFLAREGGHIGYGVLKEFRGHGYATEILRQSLAIARGLGVDRVLVTCDDDNLASARVIERCGAILESVIAGENGVAKRRYWID